MNKKSKERSYKQIVKLVNDLADGYDTVQIFLTKHTNSNEDIEDTESIHYGLGNKFAILGQVRNWLLTEENRMSNIFGLEFEDDSEDED